MCSNNYMSLNFEEYIHVRGYHPMDASIVKNAQNDTITCDYETYIDDNFIENFRCIRDEIRNLIFLTTEEQEHYANIINYMCSNHNHKIHIIGAECICFHKRIGDKTYSVKLLNVRQKENCSTNPKYYIMIKNMQPAKPCRDTLMTKKIHKEIGNTLYLEKLYFSIENMKIKLRHSKNFIEMAKMLGKIMLTKDNMNYAGKIIKNESAFFFKLMVERIICLVKSIVSTLFPIIKEYFEEHVLSKLSDRTIAFTFLNYMINIVLHRIIYVPYVRIRSPLFYLFYTIVGGLICSFFCSTLAKNNAYVVINAHLASSNLYLIYKMMTSIRSIRIVGNC